MRLEFDFGELGTGSNALELGVIGFKSNPTDDEGRPSQVYIEVYDGKLHVHVWDGSSRDPLTTIINPFVPNQPKACELSERLVGHTAHKRRSYIPRVPNKTVVVVKMDAADVDKQILRKRLLGLIAEGGCWLHQVVSHFTDPQTSEEVIKEAVTGLVSQGLVIIDSNGQLNLRAPINRKDYSD